MIFKVSLNELMEANGKEDTENILLSFSSVSKDIEFFLHNLAINYETSGISRTYLVFVESNENIFLAGYYSIANKALNITKKNYERLTTSQKKKLAWSGYKDNKGNFVASSVLLGQLGKNYSIAKDKNITGKELLGIAYQTIKEVYNLLGGKVLWLECEDTPFLRKFYEKNGFGLLKGFQSETGLLVYTKKLSHL